jgi:hypothetical protein
VGVALPVQLGIKRDDFVIDPCLRPRVGAAADNAFKIAIECNAIGLLPDGAAQAARHMDFINRQYAAPLRIVPCDIGGMARFRHREDAHAVRLQHDIRGDDHNVLTIFSVSKPSTARISPAATGTSS